MGVKYVKDFSFPSSGGFHGNVQRYAKGGHVTKMPAKAKASAKDMPARAKPNAPAKGAPKMESKPAKGKRQGYNEGGRVPGYEMDRLPTKRPPGRGMDLAPARRFKGAYEGYEDGGEVAMPSPAKPQIAEEYDFFPDIMRPSEPIHYVWSDGTYNYAPEETGRRTPLKALSSGLRAKDPRSQEPVYARNVETRLDRGVRPGQMARQQRMEDRVNAARQAMFEDKAPSYLLPPEEPQYLVPEMPDYDRSPIMPAPSAPTKNLGFKIPPPSNPEVVPYMVPTSAPRPFKKGGEVKGKSKIGKVMGEYKAGKLHSGSKKGPVVKSEKQAMAIALSEARKAGAKIPKKAEGGIFSNEYMAYESKGPKTRYSAARSRRMSKERAMERRALDKARHAEKYAPGMSLDMADRKAHGGMMKGKKFPDLTGDGKVTRADVLKGRGAFKNGGMPTHRRKPMYGGGKC